MTHDPGGSEWEAQPDESVMCSSLVIVTKIERKGAKRMVCIDSGSIESGARRSSDWLVL